MIVRYIKHTDKPNEVDVFLTRGQFDTVNAAFAERGYAGDLAALDEASQRRYCRGILELSDGSRAQREIVELDDNIRLDSNELGHNFVENSRPEQDRRAFDPDREPVDFNFRMLDEVGDQIISEVTADPARAESSRIDEALRAAELVVSFSLRPPAA